VSIGDVVRYQTSLEVVVDEGLQQHRVHSLIAPATNRSLVINQPANHPRALDRQHDARGSHAPFAVAEQAITRGGQCERRPTPQITLLGFDGEKKKLG
jgi:hypothetical protein